MVGPADLDLASIATRLAPTLPMPSVESPVDHAGPRAAVAAILRASPRGTEVLLIQRAPREDDPWSGHMALPGGRYSASDRDLCATAIREVREEVGIDLEQHGRLLGRLPDLDAVARARRTGLVIAPFVFTIDDAAHAAAALTVDPREVAEALWAPLALLTQPQAVQTMRYEREGMSLDLPCWHVEGRVVWGLTYRMLQSLFEVLCD